MNLSNILVVIVLCGTALSFNFTWTPIVKVPREKSATVTSYHTTSDASTHLFWNGNAPQFKGFLYQRLLPSGVMLNRSRIAFTDNAINYTISTQVSKNGSHLLLAYSGFLSKTNSSIYFTESLNRGRNWSNPILVAKDVLHDADTPLIVFEEKTGRVYILFKTYADTHIHIAISIKEPGKNTFESPIILPDIKGLNKVSFVKTVDKEQYYLHVVASTNEGNIVYTRSSDNGKQWTVLATVGHYLYNNTDFSNFLVVSNTNIDESGIHVLYNDENGTKILRSRDHGNTLESVTLTKSNTRCNRFSMCGSNGKGILVSAYIDSDETNSFIAYAPLNNIAFTLLPYPYEKDLQKKLNENYMVDCRYMGGNQYSLIVSAGESLDFDQTYMRQGILKETLVKS